MMKKMGKNKERMRLGEIALISAGQGAPQGEALYCLDGIPVTIQNPSLQNL